MAFRFTLPPFPNSRHLVPGLVFAACLGAQVAFLAPARNWILEQEIAAPSAAWMVQISDHLGRFEAALAAGDAAATERAKMTLRTAIESALRSGHIFQLDLIDPATGRHVSVGSHTGHQALSGSGGGPWSDAAVLAAVRAILDGTEAGARTAPLPGQVPVEHAAVAVAGGGRAPRMEVVTATRPDLPRIHAIAEAPGLPGGLTLRLGFDLTENAHALNVTGAWLATLVSLLVALSAGQAARASDLARRMKKSTQAEIAFMAEHDSLTGALNRRGFEAAADEMLDECRRWGQRALLLAFDADKFKEINDTHGHAAGDIVLNEIAAKIRWALPDTALVARMGGDEFCALVREADLGSQADDPDLGIPPETEVSLDEARQRLTVRTSAGMAAYPEDGRDLDALVRAADLALITVKRTGRGRTARYDSSMTTALKRRAWELDGVREAIGAGALRPHYQPILDTGSGRVEGLESLVRWSHPVLGTLAPERFAEALADPRVGQAVTRRMVDCIVEDLAEMRARNLPLLSVGLNLGENDFRDPSLPDDIAAQLAAAGLPARSIAIEVTENSLTSENRDAARAMLQRFRDHGCHLALDDFGTGTSSITLLKDLPCTTLKIDKSFVRNVLDSPSDRAIVESLTGLGHELGMKIIAEGVERPGQLRLMREIGVDQVQGYLVSPAVSLGEVIEIVRRRRRGADREAPEGGVPEGGVRPRLKLV